MLPLFYSFYVVAALAPLALRSVVLLVRSAELDEPGIEGLGFPLPPLSQTLPLRYCVVDLLWTYLGFLSLPRVRFPCVLVV